MINLYNCLQRILLGEKLSITWNWEGRKIPENKLDIILI